MTVKNRAVGFSLREGMRKGIGWQKLSVIHKSQISEETCLQLTQWMQGFYACHFHHLIAELQVSLRMAFLQEMEPGFLGSAQTWSCLEERQGAISLSYNHYYV